MVLGRQGLVEILSSADNARPASCRRRPWDPVPGNPYAIVPPRPSGRRHQSGSRTGTKSSKQSPANDSQRGIRISGVRVWAVSKLKHFWGLFGRKYQVNLLIAAALELNMNRRAILPRKWLYPWPTADGSSYEITVNHVGGRGDSPSRIGAKTLSPTRKNNLHIYGRTPCNKRHWRSIGPLMGRGDCPYAKYLKLRKTLPYD